MKNFSMKYVLIALSLTLAFAVEAKEETVLTTFTCTTPRRIGFSTANGPLGEVSGTAVQIQKRQQGEKVYFVYMQNIFPSFDPVDQGTFVDIGIPWGRTKDGVISSVEDKKIFLASASAFDLQTTTTLRVTRIAQQDYSICQADATK
jgi:hypothetical protein